MRSAVEAEHAEAEWRLVHESLALRSKDEKPCRAVAHVTQNLAAYDKVRPFLEGLPYSDKALPSGVLDVILFDS
jgi:hypothetical protein